MNGGRLAGKVVAGASRGRGAAEAAAPEREGATVVATDVNGGEGVRRLDVTLADDWADLADFLRGTCGAVHGLVDDAGVAWRARPGEVTAKAMSRVP
ncbi:Rossmann-fold NAD(P)-binding domain-containing protein [Streptomyces litmocidini]|uniref:hypothetical protein n=1 Tax=Streptomyces litmocidini TaxID=67318 RepID=UPI003702F48F